MMAVSQDTARDTARLAGISQLKLLTERRQEGNLAGIVAAGIRKAPLSIEYSVPGKNQRIAGGTTSACHCCTAGRARSGRGAGVGRVSAAVAGHPEPFYVPGLRAGRGPLPPQRPGWRWSKTAETSRPSSVSAWLAGHRAADRPPMNDLQGLIQSEVPINARWVVKKAGLRGWRFGQAPAEQRALIPDHDEGTLIQALAIDLSAGYKSYFNDRSEVAHDKNYAATAVTRTPHRHRPPRMAELRPGGESPAADRVESEQVPRDRNAIFGSDGPVLHSGDEYRGRGELLRRGQRSFRRRTAGRH